ncbi:hypothetical protein LCGC14_2068290, partial [marine sediment metagenome]
MGTASYPVAQTSSFHAYQPAAAPNIIGIAVSGEHLISFVSSPPQKLVS